MYETTIRNYDLKMKNGAAKYSSYGNNVRRATYFVFADIDKDGIDELILHYDSVSLNVHRTNGSSGFGENTYIYTIIDNKVKLVLNNGYEKGAYCPDFVHNNFIHVYKDSSLINRGFSHMPHDDIFYKYKNGKVASSPSLRLVRGGDTWMINGKRASSKACFKEFDRASNHDTGYEMYKYSAVTFSNFI